MREMTKEQAVTARNFLKTLADGVVTLKALNGYRDAHKTGLSFALARCTKVAKGQWEPKPLTAEIEKLLGPDDGAPAKAPKKSGKKKAAKVKKPAKVEEPVSVTPPQPEVKSAPEDSEPAEQEVVELPDVMALVEGGSLQVSA